MNGKRPFFFDCFDGSWKVCEHVIKFSFKNPSCIDKSLFLLSYVLAVCKPGYYSTNNGISPCVECPMGTYQNNDQQTQCFACPAGTNTASTGSTSLEDCLCK